MKRIEMLVAVVTLGTAALTAREAPACEHHTAAPRAAPESPPPTDKQAAKAAGPEDATEHEDPRLHAAKCQCGSAADCTCKKGTCECPRCKKPRHDAPPPAEQAERPASSGALEA